MLIVDIYKAADLILVVKPKPKITNPFSVDFKYNVHYSFPFQLEKVLQKYLKLIMEAKTNKITFKLDPINDQKYGTATKLEGKLEFMLKPEEFYFPESIRNVERLNKATNELVPILRDLWPDLLDEQVFTKIKDYAMASSLLNGLDLENPRMKILTIWCALGKI